MSVPNLQSGPPTMLGQPYAPTTKFGLTTWERDALKEAAKGGQTAVSKIYAKKTADKVANVFDHGKVGRFFARDVRVGGLSLEDMSSRFLTLFGLYIPQGILAVKAKKHPYETNGRNVVVWVMTFYLMQFLKNDNFGINSLLLNPLMLEKGKLQAFNKKTDIPANAGFIKKMLHGTFKPPLNYLQRVANKTLGMNGNYLDVLKDSGIHVSQGDIKKALLSTKSPWASLDNNQLDLINNRYGELKKLVSKDGIEALGKMKEPVSEALYKTYPKVIRRLNMFPMISASLLTAATVYVIGGVAMQIVYRFIAPLDKDFNPEAFKARNNKKKNHVPTPVTPQPSASLAAPFATPAAPALSQPMPTLSLPQPAAGNFQMSAPAGQPPQWPQPNGGQL